MNWAYPHGVWAGPVKHIVDVLGDLALRDMEEPHPCTVIIDLPIVNGCVRAARQCGIIVWLRRLTAIEGGDIVWRDVEVLGNGATVIRVPHLLRHEEAEDMTPTASVGAVDAVGPLYGSLQDTLKV